MQPSVQLYSVREDLTGDHRATLTRLRDLGLEVVEPYDLAGLGASLAPVLADLGLRAPSAHTALLDPQQAQDSFAAAAATGTTILIQPVSDKDRWLDEESIRGVAEDLNAAAALAREHSLRIGYHNHAFEFAADFGGRTGLHVLAEHLDEEVGLELDIFWAASAGVDVPDLVRDLGDRVRALHVKDGELFPDGRQLPLGAGDVEVAEILAAATASQLAVLEFDHYDGDVFDGLGQSLTWLQGALA